MNWIKDNKKLAGILGVMIVGGISLGVWLYLAYDSFSSAMGDWEAMSSKVSTMQKAPVFPSAKNVTMVGKKIDDYREKFNDLRKVLLDSKLQREEKPLSETEFQAKVKERAVAVKKKADAAVVGLPAGDFALGFEEYKDSLPPSAAVASKLNVHLDVMESFVNTLIESGVKSLDLLERTRLSDEKASGKASPASAPAPAPSGKQGAPRAAPLAAAEPVLDRYTIKCIMTTDQFPLQNVLNVLSNPAKMPHFLAVRQMRVENERPEGRTKEEIKNIKSQNSGSPSTPNPPANSNATVARIATPDPLPPDAVTIMGEELLKIYLEVDYVRFRQPTAEGAGIPPR